MALKFKVNGNMHRIVGSAEPFNDFEMLIEDIDTHFKEVYELPIPDMKVEMLQWEDGYLMFNIIYQDRPQTFWVKPRNAIWYNKELNAYAFETCFQLVEGE